MIIKSRTLVPFAADPKEKVEEAADGAAAAANVLEVAAEGEEPNENPGAAELSL